MQRYIHGHNRETDAMQRLVLDEAVKPLSEFRSSSARFVQHVRDTKRPMLLTRRGRSAAVLLDVGEYERMLEKLNILEEIQHAETQLEQGMGVAHAEAKERVLGGIGRED
jgi:prevent-host-death family protein